MLHSWRVAASPDLPRFRLRHRCWRCHQLPLGSPKFDTNSSVSFWISGNAVNNLTFAVNNGTNGFPLQVDPTAEFKLGTLSFTNGTWISNAIFGFSIVVEDDNGFSQFVGVHTFTGFVTLNLTAQTGIAIYFLGMGGRETNVGRRFIRTSGIGSCFTTKIYADCSRLLSGVDEFPYPCEMMIVVFGDKIQMVHEPHRRLQTRVGNGSGK